MIEGVRVERLDVSVDELGRRTELFRTDDGVCPGFGQVHLEVVHPAAIKGWRRHAKTTVVFAPVAGTARLGLSDDRPDSKTEAQLNEFFLTPYEPLKIRVPPGVWYGLKGAGAEDAVVAVYGDVPTDSTDPDIEHLDPHVNEFPYDWDRCDR
jgi:dTDP-4-dehydrorhamnose 3,5-epimerase-like enzyme